LIKYSSAVVQYYFYSTKKHPYLIERGEIEIEGEKEKTKKDIEKKQKRKKSS
jgi:hypothetical protein